MMFRVYSKVPHEEWHVTDPLLAVEMAWNNPAEPDICIMSSAKGSALSMLSHHDISLLARWHPRSAS